MGNFSMGNSFNPHAVVSRILDKENSKSIIWYNEDENKDVLLESNQFLNNNDYLCVQQSKKKVLIKENRKYSQICKRLGR